MKKIFLLLIYATSSIFFINAQISTDEEPVSFHLKNISMRKTAATEKLDIAKSVNWIQVEKEDLQNDQNGIPPRFGIKKEVNYTLTNSGTWTTLENGDKLWQLSIHSEGALSINLLYDQFRLPEGAKFFVYNEDHTHILGAFTSINNKGTKEDIQGFATGLIYGDKIILEYFQPAETKEEGVISVAYVIHGYRYIQLAGITTRSYGQSASCHININCPEGQPWQAEKNAVALIIIDGNALCSGALINTTAQDSRPVFLTANHCLGTYDAVAKPNLNYSSFYWHYEAPGCTSTNAPLNNSTVGATVIANNQSSDFALLRLAEDPINKNGVTPFYLGWDRSGNTGGSNGVSIHHPKGDIKKISLYNGISNYSNSIKWTDGFTSSPNTHWQVSFYKGGLENGSSGSPLINSSRRVIGQLHGGSGSCAPINNYYGKLNISWTGNGSNDPRRRLKDWLDPVNRGVNTLESFELGITGADYVKCTGTEIYHIPYPGTWTISYGLQIISGQGSKTLTVQKAAATSGSATISATYSLPSGTRKNISKQVIIGTPPLNSIRGSEGTYTHASQIYSAYPEYSTSLGYYEWSVYPANATLTPSNQHCRIEFSSSGYYEVRCRFRDCAEPSGWTVLYVSVSGGYRVAATPSKQVQVVPEFDSEQSLGSQKLVPYSLYNQATGLKVKTGEMPAEGGILDFSDQPSGLYILQLKTEGKQYDTHKVLLKSN